MDRTQFVKDLALFARSLAKYSPCKRRGVACVVIDADTLQIIGWGVNQPACGDPAACTGIKDACGCLHSEVQTILNCEPRSDNSYMIASRAPCVPCATVIVNCGYIRHVYVLDDSEPGAQGIAVLRSCGVTVSKLSVPDNAEISLRNA